MSSISLDPIRESHPDLSEVTSGVSGWLTARPHREFLDSRAIFRDLGGEFTAEEIVNFFAALKASGLVLVFFRIVDDQGSFIEGKYDRLDDVPDDEEDTSGEPFNVGRSNIVQVYEFRS